MLLARHFSNPPETFFFSLIFFFSCTTDLKGEQKHFHQMQKVCLWEEIGKNILKELRYLLLTIFAVKIDYIIYYSVWLHSLLPFALDNVTYCSRSICLWQFCLSVCSVIYVKLCSISGHFGKLLASLSLHSIFHWNPSSQSLPEQQCNR